MIELLSKLMLSRIVLSAIIVICLVPFPACAGGEDYTFQDQWEEGFTEAIKVFHDNGYCELRNIKCLDSNDMYFSVLNKGFKIWLYGVEDPVIIQKILDIFVAIYLKNPSIREIDFVSYKYTKNQSMDHLLAPIISQTPPIIDVKMRRDK